MIGFAGWSGSGKTSLIEKVVAVLSGRGLDVSLIKHAHHTFDIDHEGKDSWRHRNAGCREVLVSSGRRWSLMHELRGDPELPLDELLQKLSPCDLVLVEGFKTEPIPKLEVFRPANGKPPLYPERQDIVAVASDVEFDAPLPRLPLNDAAVIADFILDFWKLRSRNAEL